MDADLLVEAIRIFKNNCPNLYLVSINTNGFYTQRIKDSIEKILSEHKFIGLTIGVAHIPNKTWGKERTGIQSAYERYQQILKILNKMEKSHPNKLNYYKMFTLSNKSDIDLIERDEKLWLNFVETSDFYNNTDQDSKDMLSIQEKMEAIDCFLELNKKHTSYLNKKFISYWKIN